MKTFFEKHRDRLTAEERRAVWNAIRAGEGVRGTARRGRRPARVAWGAAALAAAAVLAVLLLRPAPEVVPPQVAVSIEREQSAGGREAGSATGEQTRPSLADQQGPSQTIEPPKTGEVEKPARAVRATETPVPVAKAEREGTETARRSPEPPSPSRAKAGAGADVATQAGTPVGSLQAAIPDSTSAESLATRIPVSPGMGQILGTVRDSDGKPLPYANVLILGTAWGAMTNERGEFLIRDVPVKSYEVKATCIGFGPATETAVVREGAAARIDFVLAPALLTMTDNVEITAARERIVKKSASTRHENRIEALVVPDEFAMKIAAPSPPVYPTTGGTTLPNDEPFDSMFFEHYGVNPFVPADEDSLSTFAVDVDTGSYTVTRRYIDEGFLPPKDAVRVEEFVNYFEQGYPTFYDEDFRILIDGAPAPFAGSDYRLIRVGLKARDVDARDRKPANLVFVVDVSGSMAREDRLELVKKALAILLDQLRTADRIGIVVYGSTGQAILEPTSDRERIRAAIEELRPSGSTNAEEGLRLAYDMARRAYDAHRINRILLCSDGVANVGVTGPEAILQTIRQEADRGIQLTTIGFGMGNYNDVLMEKLADKGDGAYYYVDDLPEARRVFVENLTGTLQTIARDVKVQVAFDPRLVSLYRLIGFENRDVRDQDFRNDKIDAGEVGAGHEVTALYEVKLAGEAAERSGRGRLLTVRLRWALPESVTEGAPAVREIERKLDARDLASRFESAAPRLRMDAAVAEFAEILRGSYWAKGSRIADLLPIVRPLAAELAGDERVSEFAGMVERAVHLEATLTPEQQRERQGGGREGWPPEPRSGPEPQPGAPPVVPLERDGGPR